MERERKEEVEEKVAEALMEYIVRVSKGEMTSEAEVEALPGVVSGLAQLMRV